jgi:hypothetical protein
MVFSFLNWVMQIGKLIMLEPDQKYRRSSRLCYNPLQSRLAGQGF